IFGLLRELVAEYSILMENIYNMDEKGIQLGIGAFIDRDQATVYNIEHASSLQSSRLFALMELALLPPSVIYQGACRDFEWSQNNPCHASVSHSPKGWTDQELGLKWLQKDFKPQTAQQNQSDGYRLLILDGHNSHGTYKFCKFTADHRIIILCLPSHTTHVLQPLDVGIVGPLASAWKKQVNEASWQFIAIKKNNLLAYHKLAHDKAMLPTTIQSAFAKTGIHP
ncbi:DDE-domain-containing protein, partial [Gyrodon lividus]